MEKSWKYVTISVAAFICYCNTLWGTFVFDDSEAIVKNRDIRPTAPLLDMFKNDFWGTDIKLNSSHKSYRPLTILSYRLNVLYSNNKLDAFQFHATNVILYGLLCILTIPVFELFLIKTYKQQRKLNRNNINEITYMASLLFTVHPVHTECVAGLVGRADILSSILFFSILLLYYQFLKTKSISLFVLTNFLILCAVLCKETAITILAICVIYDFYLSKKRKHSWLKTILNSTFLLRSCVLTVICFIILYYRFKIMNFESPIFTSIDNPAAYAENFLVRVFSYNYIYFLNFLLLLWPQWLCFDWSMGCLPLIETINDYRLIFVVIFWLLSILTVFTLIKRTINTGSLEPRILGLSLLIVPFLPASNLLIKVGFVIAERTLLLPSAGFCFLVALGVKRIENYVPHYRHVLLSIFYGICVIFMLRTIQRNIDWLIEERLFNSALDVCPLNAKVHYNIGKIAADKNNKQLAISEYRIAIELNQNYEQAMNNLANLLREDKQFKEAEILLRKAIEIRPNFAAAWMNLGIVLTNLNQTNEAELCYKKAIEYRNKYPDCYYNLGNLYLDMKRNEDALKSWEMAINYRPTHTAAWSNILILLDNLKRYDNVIKMSKLALLHNPNSSTIHFCLANTLGKIQQFDEAEQHFYKAINLSPGEKNNAIYYSNLGVLYHRWGRLNLAKNMYKKALELDPTLKNTEANLKKIEEQI